MKELDKLVENYFEEKEAPELTSDLLLEMVGKSIDEALEDADLTPKLYQSIISISRDMGEGNINQVNIKAKNQIRRLASLSKTFYGDELYDLYELFPASAAGNSILKPRDFNPEQEPDSPEAAYWKAYSESTSKATKGEKIEDALAAYFNFKRQGSSETLGATGKDVQVGDVTIEVKSSKSSTPNFQLNSSAVVPDPKKAYIFVVNSETDNPNFVSVSSHLLYKVAMFRLLQDSEGLEAAVGKAVTDALSGQDVNKMIAQTIISGNPEFDIPKTLKIGKSPLRARIRIMFSLGKIEE